ncbi:MAG: hypothetical protein OPY07_06605 [Nitrosopumilus sp.]|nr:hypothetical protein [Nitrosopumilus sp.]
MIQLLVYRNEHNCNSAECTELTAYIRVEGKWVRVGHYGSECNRFDSLDLQSEERDRETKEKLADIKSQLRQFKQESRARRKTIENELNMTRSFFK